MSTVAADEIVSPLGTTVIWTTSSTFALRYAEIQLPPTSVPAIDMTDIAVTAYRLQLFDTLKTIGEMNLKGFYDPNQTVPYGVNDTITLTFPLRHGYAVTDKWVFWGAVTNFVPGNMVLEDSTGVSCDVTVSISNLNATRVETGPAYTAATT